MRLIKHATSLIADARTRCWSGRVARKHHLLHPVGVREQEHRHGALGKAAELCTSQARGGKPTGRRQCTGVELKAGGNPGILSGKHLPPQPSLDNKLAGCWGHERISKKTEQETESCGGRRGVEWEAGYRRTRAGKSPSQNQHGAACLCQLKKPPRRTVRKDTGGGSVTPVQGAGISQT